MAAMIVSPERSADLVGGWCGAPLRSGRPLSATCASLLARVRGWPAGTHLGRRDRCLRDRFIALVGETIGKVAPRSSQWSIPSERTRALDTPRFATWFKSLQPALGIIDWVAAPAAGLVASTYLGWGMRFCCRSRTPSRKQGYHEQQTPTSSTSPSASLGRPDCPDAVRRLLDSRLHPGRSVSDGSLRDGNGTPALLANRAVDAKSRRPVPTHAQSKQFLRLRRPVVAMSEGRDAPPRLSPAKARSWSAVDALGGAGRRASNTSGVRNSGVISSRPMVSAVSSSSSSSTVWPVALAMSSACVMTSITAMFSATPAGISPKGSVTAFSNAPGH